MPQLYANNAYGLLASSVSAVATTLTLASGNGARFPNPTGGDFFLLTLIGLDSNGNESSWEIVKCTARSTDALTVVRAQESTTGAIWAGNTRVELRATAGGFGTYLVASNLSTYAPLASPTLTGTPAAPTAAVDTNTTQIATTAYVVGQAYLKSATASSTYQTQAGMSSYLTTASASSTYAPLASPTMTGTPAAPTAAVDTNTTQLATTAYVIGQGYLKSATASSTYAPLASPTLTGTPAAPTAAANTNTTQLATTAFVLGQGNSTALTIAMNGTQAAGSSNLYARADHVHPSDTSRAPLASPTFTGTPAAPTASANTSTTQLATTAYVIGQGNSTALTIAMNGTQAAGSSNLYARADHVHPSDTSRAALASPTFTGTPAAPTAAVDTNTTQVATTAYVVGQGYLKSATASSTYAPLASPTLTGTPAAPTAAVDTNTTQVATTAYVIGQGYLKSATASSTYQTQAGMSSYLTTATASSTYQTQAGMSSYLTTASASSTYLPLAGGSIAGTLTFSGTGRRIIADFDNATLSSRAAFQTSTTNGTTAVQAIANGTGAASYYVAFAGSDPANAAYGWISATTSGIDIYSDKNGTGSVQPIRFLTGGSVRASIGALGGVDLATGLREAKVTMGANDVDLRAGNYFTKTISGATTLTVSNVPSTGTVASFILDLTNGGSSAITWWSGTKWAGGTAPTLTAAGRDVLGFFTHDGGTTWSGLVLGKDVK